MGESHAATEEAFAALQSALAISEARATKAEAERDRACKDRDLFKSALKERTAKYRALKASRTLAEGRLEGAVKLVRLTHRGIPWSVADDNEAAAFLAELNTPDQSSGAKS